MNYDNVFHELSVTGNGVVMRNNLIVVPDSLIDKVIDVAHEGHQGITKTKALIRTKVWFPKLDDLVERNLKSCYTCLIRQVLILTE